MPAARAARSDVANYDLCIIGAGSGGLAVAAGAAQLGAKVALVEANLMGGDCLNYGCVPSKALIAAANRAQGFRDAEVFGIRAVEPEIEFPAVKRHIRQVIDAIAPHDSQERFERLGADVIRARARFVGPREVEADGRRIGARRFVIATGSTAAVPPIKGLDRVPYLTNETIFDLQDRPEHLVILGGGPIGVEMAQAHRRLGCRVTVIERGKILSKDDSELVAVVRARLVAEGVDLLEDTEVASVRVEGDCVVVGLEGAPTADVTGSHLLVATGRKPAIDDIGLEVAGVERGEKGIRVDARLRTSNKRIYAIGDCREGPQFTHVAGYEAGIVVRNALFRLPAKVDFAALPWVTYTDPELAHVGLTEKEAREKHRGVRVLRWSFEDNDRARTERRTDGLIKVVAAGNRAVGVTIVGPHAGELIHGWGLAISAGLSLRKLSDTIVAYPTLSEVSKSVAGSAYTGKLFSMPVRALVRILGWLP